MIHKQYSLHTLSIYLHFFKIKKYLFCAYKCFTYMHLCVPCVCITSRDQEGASDLLGLELQTTMLGTTFWPSLSASSALKLFVQALDLILKTINK